MIARDAIPALLDDAGWYPLRGTDYGITYYRWRRGWREELTVNFDRGGRVSAWTVWRNERIGEPDQAPGNRTRLTEFIATVKP